MKKINYLVSLLSIFFLVILGSSSIMAAEVPSGVPGTLDGPKLILNSDWNINDTYTINSTDWDGIDTLNLNGQTVTINNGGALGLNILKSFTIEDTEGTGSITTSSADSRVISIGTNGVELTPAVQVEFNGIKVTSSATGTTAGVVVYGNSELTLTNNTNVSSENAAAIAVFGNYNTSYNAKPTPVLNVESATVSSINGYAISTNGSDLGNPTINIEGGTVESTNSIAIYLPAYSGSTTISGGDITGSTGIGIKGGSLDVTGGTISGNGAWTPQNNGNNNGMSADGSAIAIGSGTKAPGNESGYYGNVEITISGGNVESESAPALNQQGLASGANSTLTTINITGGELTGKTPDSTNLNSAINIDTEETEVGSKVDVSGGTFSEAIPKDYLSDSVEYKATSSNGPVSYFTSEEDLNDYLSNPENADQTFTVNEVTEGESSDPVTVTKVTYTNTVGSETTPSLTLSYTAGSTLYINNEIYTVDGSIDNAIEVNISEIYPNYADYKLNSWENVNGDSKEALENPTTLPEDATEYTINLNWTQVESRLTIDPSTVEVYNNSASLETDYDFDNQYVTALTYAPVNETNVEGTVYKVYNFGTTEPTETELETSSNYTDELTLTANTLGLSVSEDNEVYYDATASKLEEGTYYIGIQADAPTYTAAYGLLTLTVSEPSVTFTPATIDLDPAGETSATVTYEVKPAELGTVSLSVSGQDADYPYITLSENKINGNGTIEVSLYDPWGYALATSKTLTVDAMFDNEQLGSFDTNIAAAIPTALTLNQTNIQLMHQTRATLTATVMPRGYSADSVTWTTSDPEVVNLYETTGATISIGGYGLGTATVTATLTVNDVTLTAECQVTVYEEAYASTSITINPSTDSTIMVGDTTTYTVDMTSESGVTPTYPAYITVLNNIDGIVSLNTAMVYSGGQFTVTGNVPGTVAIYATTRGIDKVAIDSNTVNVTVVAQPSTGYIPSTVTFDPNPVTILGQGTAGVDVTLSEAIPELQYEVYLQGESEPLTEDIPFVISTTTDTTGYNTVTVSPNANYYVDGTYYVYFYVGEPTGDKGNSPLVVNTTNANVEETVSVVMGETASTSISLNEDNVGVISTTGLTVQIWDTTEGKLLQSARGSQAAVYTNSTGGTLKAQLVTGANGLVNLVITTNEFDVNAPATMALRSIPSSAARYQVNVVRTNPNNSAINPGEETTLLSVDLGILAEDETIDESIYMIPGATADIPVTKGEVLSNYDFSNLTYPTGIESVYAESNNIYVVTNSSFSTTGSVIIPSTNGQDPIELTVNYIPINLGFSDGSLNASATRTLSYPLNTRTYTVTPSPRTGGAYSIDGISYVASQPVLDNSTTPVALYNQDGKTMGEVSTYQVNNYGFKFANNDENTGIGYIIANVSIEGPEGVTVSPQTVTINIVKDYTTLEGLAFSSETGVGINPQTVSVANYPTGNINYLQLLGLFDLNTVFAQTPATDGEFEEYAAAMSNLTTFQQAVSSGQLVFTTSDPSILRYNGSGQFSFGRSYGQVQIYVQNKAGNISSMYAPNNVVQFLTLNVTGLMTNATLYSNATYYNSGTEQSYGFTLNVTPVNSGNVNSFNWTISGPLTNNQPAQFTQVGSTTTYTTADNYWTLDFSDVLNPQLTYSGTGGSTAVGNYKLSAIAKANTYSGNTRPNPTTVVRVSNTTVDTLLITENDEIVSTPINIDLAEGNTIQFAYQAEDINGNPVTGTTVNWSVSPSGYATITNGLLTIYRVPEDNNLTVSLMVNGVLASNPVSITIESTGADQDLEGIEAIEDPYYVSFMTTEDQDGIVDLINNIMPIPASVALDPSTLTFTSSNTDLVVTPDGILSIPNDSYTGETTITVEVELADETTYTLTFDVIVTDPVYVSSLTADETITLMYGSGETANVDAKLMPEDTTVHTQITYESTNELVAEVDTYGNVRANSEGTATIISTATVGVNTYKAYTVVNVETETPEYEITLDPTTLNLTTEEDGITTGTITATVEPEGIVEWSIEPETVATLTSEGNVATITAVSDGVATVTAKIGDTEETAQVIVSSEDVVASYIEVTAGSTPDYFTVTAYNVVPNPALEVEGDEVQQVAMFAWSEESQDDINAKDMTRIDGTNNWVYEDIPVNDTPINNYFWYADDIIINVYGSVVEGSNGNMIGAANYSWIQDFADTDASVYYIGYSQNLGFDKPTVSSGIAGTTGQALQLEGIRVSSNIPGVKVESDIHVQNIGWLSETEGGYLVDGEYAGTMHQNLQAEAIRLRLTGDLAEEYSIQYRVHVQNLGWLPWTEDDQIAGTTGQNLQAEAFIIRIVPAGTALPGADVF